MAVRTTGMSGEDDRDEQSNARASDRRERHVGSDPYARRGGDPYAGPGTRVTDPYDTRRYQPE